MYSAESPVKHKKVSFDGTMISLGLKAQRDILVGCPILLTLMSLSLDLVPEGTLGISIIKASSGQIGPLGHHVMLGPLQFANQDCQLNGQIWSVVNSYTYMLWLITEIKEGESIMVQYRKDTAYFAGKYLLHLLQVGGPWGPGWWGITTHAQEKVTPRGEEEV
ncbi:hypothetical protein L208DRAFT_1375955 [Tricholoma matsutake]|nr:hypothetical protein L208DRAFT_1375955 [Tricholoma matsutake 945]